MNGTCTTCTLCINRELLVAKLKHIIETALRSELKTFGINLFVDEIPLLESMRLIDYNITEDSTILVVKASEQIHKIEYSSYDIYQKEISLIRKLRSNTYILNKQNEYMDITFSKLEMHGDKQYFQLLSEFAKSHDDNGLNIK